MEWLSGREWLAPWWRGVISRTIKGSAGIEKLTKTTRMLQFNESRRATLDLELTREWDQPNSQAGNELTFIMREGSKAKFQKSI